MQANPEVLNLFTPNQEGFSAQPETAAAAFFANVYSTLAQADTTDFSFTDPRFSLENMLRITGTDQMQERLDTIDRAVDARMATRRRFRNTLPFSRGWREAWDELPTSDKNLSTLLTAIPFVGPFLGSYPSLDPINHQEEYKEEATIKGKGWTRDIAVDAYHTSGVNKQEINTTLEETVPETNGDRHLRRLRYVGHPLQRGYDTSSTWITDERWQNVPEGEDGYRWREVIIDYLAFEDVIHIQMKNYDADDRGYTLQVEFTQGGRRRTHAEVEAAKRKRATYGGYAGL